MAVLINAALAAINAALAAWNFTSGHMVSGAFNAGAAVFCGLMALAMAADA